jgi:hypothetical protein
MRGELVTRAEATEHQVGMRPRECGLERAGADDHEAERAATRPLHGAIRRDGQLDVLLGREAADIEDDQIPVARAPRLAQRRRAPRRIEAPRVDAPAEDAQSLEPRRSELGAKGRCRDQGAGRAL